ncbi:hypothetical protein PybrP1_008419 [[Pythium] brassicae (nom. inval.)]|nr:hypothetical protein PybrP1_008419 [[Pythium] brassicae (nom. inval.)]
MHHEQQYATGAQRPTATSPKKKTGKHAVTRQIFALPALQQFEPVLASSPRSCMVPTGSIPKIDTGASKGARSIDSRLPSSGSIKRGTGSRRNSASEVEARPESPSAVALAVAHAPPASLALPQRPRDRGSSPRVSRAQPPPAGISAKADVDIYRYSQGTAQRMAIRPIFEQRKEDEALVARQIIAQRKSERRVSEQEEVEPPQRQQQPPFDESSARYIEDEEVQEFTRITFVSPRSASAHRKRPGSGEPTEQRTLQVVTPERFGVAAPRQRPTDSSASCETGSTETQSDGDHSSHLVPSGEVAPAESSSPTASPRSPTSALAEADEPLLVQPLLPGRYYEPFITVDHGNLSARIKEVARPQSTAPAAVAAKQPQCAVQESERALPSQVLYRVLWKELRVFQGCGEVALTARLSSEAEADVLVAYANNEGGRQLTDVSENKEARIPITGAHVALSRKLRPDLRVLTPAWAKWVLSRVQRDDGGAFYLQLESHDALSSSCCFDEDSVVVDGRHLRVEMHALSGTSLLVTVSNAESGDKSTLFLGPSEIVQLAPSFGASPPPSDDAALQDADVGELLKSSSFLSQVVTKSAVVRLAVKATDPLDSFARPELRLEPETHPPLSDAEDDSSDARPAPRSPQLRPSAFSPDVFILLLDNSALATVAFLSQAYVEDGMVSALRHLQRAEALRMHINSYRTHQVATASGEQFSGFIAAKVETAKLAKLTEIAVCAIVEDMVAELIAYECRLELYDAKYSGGYDDHFASKVQSAFRMSTQRKRYIHTQHTHARAARLLQALQRGVAARKRFAQMRIEREKYLFYGFRSSLHAATAGMADPKTRCLEIAEATERRRHAFLMHVFEGHVAESGVSLPYRVATDLVATLFSEYGVVVGCPTAFGDVVASFLRDDSDVASPRKAKAGGARRAPSRLHTSGQISAALLLALRSQCDDTFGLSAATRQSLVANRSLATPMQTADTGDVPPRWLLKLSAPFQRANRNRLAALRLLRTSAGRRASHLVARDFRNLLQSAPLASFERCREAWEVSVRSRRAERRIYDASSTELVAQHVLDNVVASIKDWGVDPEPLFAGLNVCVRHRLGTAVVALVEAQFTAFADDVNAMHGKRCVLPLRDEIAQELEDFEQLLALRCLNLGGAAATVPPSELLHVVLHGRVDDEFVRHALPTVLPVASVRDKHALAAKMARAYADASYGDALNAICWSCLDAAENVTVEAAQLLDRLTRPADEALGGGEHQPPPSSPPSSSSVASRALYLLTGAPVVTFLQFVAKVAHFNETTRRRALALLRPYAERFELHRLASALAGVDDYAAVARLFDDAFAASATYGSAPFWVQYEDQFGLECAEAARATGDHSASTSAH